MLTEMTNNLGRFKGKRILYIHTGTILHCNCSQDWLGNNEKTKSTMKHSSQTKELQHKWVQQHFMFIFQCERGG